MYKLLICMLTTSMMLTGFYLNNDAVYVHRSHANVEFMNIWQIVM